MEIIADKLTIINIFVWTMEDIVHTKMENCTFLKCFSNNKPWVTKEMKSAIYRKSIKLRKIRLSRAEGF